MQARLFDRESGDLPHFDFARSVTNELLRSFGPAPQHRFHGDRSTTAPAPALGYGAAGACAHAAGVSSLALDKFDGRLLISGGADGSIKIWDLEARAAGQYDGHLFTPVSTIARSTDPAVQYGHSHGITHLAFFPFDPGAFLSSSFDKTLRLWSTRRNALSASFDLNAIIYSHATSPIADHLLVACATQHSNVRLVDLRSGSAVQALVALGGPVLCTAWNPLHAHILVSGHADGKVRIWDVRQAGGVVALLDQEDALGVVHRATADGAAGPRVPRFRNGALAHDEAVNGLQWTDDGRYLISAGLDRRIRVWNADTGANTLASFGSIVQNPHARTASMLVTPSSISQPHDLLFWPNEHEILLFDLWNGSLVHRLRGPGATNPRATGAGNNRITSLVWRGAGGARRALGPVMGGGNSVGALYSGHMDGRIRAWMPVLPGPDDEPCDEEAAEGEEERRKKRKAVDDAYRSLMGRQITFT